jgi:L-lactate dehydrogenase complex protein LldG
MAAREAILSRLRAKAPAGPAHPALEGVGLTLADLAARFEASVAQVGGTLLRVPDLVAADHAVRARQAELGATQVISLVPGVGAATRDASTVADPHELAHLDLVVLRGALGVAEDGSCWIEGATLPHHALVVIAEHVVVVVDAATLVSDLHAAYATLELSTRPRWGLFLAGPSKTADIEQSLVIGAHGARSSLTLLVGQNP